METAKRELVERLSKENETLRDAYEVHHGYEKRIAKMEKKRALSELEKIEKKELKVLKLAKKDEIEGILAELHESGPAGTS